MVYAACKTTMACTHCFFHHFLYLLTNRKGETITSVGDNLEVNYLLNRKIRAFKAK